ncbi:hypothetical protein IJC60_00020 [bacterium]|nr:hypothetical protein [bacterium]
MKKIIMTLMALAIFTGTSHAVPIFSTSSDAEKIDIEPTKTETVKNAPKLKLNNDYFAPKAEKAETNSSQYGEIQNNSYRSAITNLDGAQVELREQLMDYKAKYTEAKTRYAAVKEECRTYKKQIKATEKKMKNIEKTKKQIAKNIQQL